MTTTIRMDLRELIEEHEQLTRLLRNIVGDMTKELIKQEKELAGYKGMRGGAIDDKARKIRYVMSEFKNGRLYSSYGTLVTNPKQAMAIALSESRKFK